MNTKITFVELVELLSESTSTTDRVCELFLRELFSTISQTLIKGRPVIVKGIGQFQVVEGKPRKGSDDFLATTSKATGHKRITFTPDKALAEALNQPFAQFKTVILDDGVTEEQLAEIDARYPSLFNSNDNDEETPQVEETTPVLEKTAETSKPQALPETQEISVDENKPEPKPEVKPEPKPEVKPEPKPEIKPEPKHKVPVAAVDLDQAPKPEPPVEPSTDNSPKRKPMLIGIPIDGPSQPVPEPEPEEEDVSNKRFYRPEPRNTYTPTPEQIEEANRKPNHRWWWPVLSLLVIGGLMWWLFSNSDSGNSENGKEIAVAAADTISDNDSILLAQEKPSDSELKSDQEKRAEQIAKSLSSDPEKKPVEKVAKEPEVKPEVKVTEADVKPAAAQKQVTDVVTSQIVLTTLAEKHYGSPWFWVYIYEENKGIISNPNNIRPGTRVVIPPPEKYGINPKDPKSLKKAQRRSWELLK